MGSADPAVREARDLLLKTGIQSDYLRIRSLPFGEEVGAFINRHDRIVVIDINRDGQLHQLLKMKFPLEAAKMVSLAHLDGLPLNARWVEEHIRGLMEVQA